MNSINVSILCWCKAAIIAVAALLCVPGISAEKRIISAVDEDGVTYQIGYNSEGLVSNILLGGRGSGMISYDWSGVANGNLTITVSTPYDEYHAYCGIDDNGCIVSYEDDGDDHDSYSFEYDPSGYVTKITCYDGSYNSLNWVDGDLSDARFYSSSGKMMEHSNGSYTSERISVPILNKGVGVTAGRLLSSYCFGLDVPSEAWISGVCGKEPKHLLAYTKFTYEGSHDGYDEYSLIWELDNEGYPTSCTVDNETDHAHWTFVWEEAPAGVDMTVVDSDADEIEAVYGADGMQRVVLQLGLNIVRYKSGRCEKTVVR